MDPIVPKDLTWRKFSAFENKIYYFEKQESVFISSITKFKKSKIVQNVLNTMYNHADTVVINNNIVLSYLNKHYIKLRNMYKRIKFLFSWGIVQ